MSILITSGARYICNHLKKDKIKPILSYVKNDELFSDNLSVGSL